MIINQNDETPMISYGGQWKTSKQPGKLQHVCEGRAKQSEKCEANVPSLNEQQPQQSP